MSVGTCGYAESLPPFIWLKSDAQECSRELLALLLYPRAFLVFWEDPQVPQHLIPAHL